MAILYESILLFLGFGAVDGFHVQCMAKDEIDFVVSA